MPELRQRKKKSKDNGDKKESAKASAAVEAQPQQDDAAAPPEGQGLTVQGRIALFLVVPFCVGSFGLYVGYLRSLADPSKRLNLDTDFIFPFMLALVTVLVVGFQTGGFRHDKVKPLVQWPQVRRKRTVIRKIVIVDDNEADAAAAEKKKDE